MTRFACVFLPYWPIERFLREQRKNAPEKRPPQTVKPRPFALVASQAGGFRLTALNVPAQTLGLLPGEQRQAVLCSAGTRYTSWSKERSFRYWSRFQRFTCSRVSSNSLRGIGL